MIPGAHPVVAFSLSSGLPLILLGLVFGYVLVMWLAIAFWVVRDARRRSESPAFLLMAMVLGFLPPFFGALVYIVLAPPRTLEDERALALEEQALVEVPAVEAPATRACPHCGRDIERDFVVCPYCRTAFARRCATCSRTIRLGWQVCPYCGEEVGVRDVGRAGRALRS